MTECSYLVFGYNQRRYAVQASMVQEVVWLPELAPLEEMPHFVCGAFNLRGKVVPVIDLGLRFAHAPLPPSLQDRVAVLQHGGKRFGILVHDVHDVLSVPDVAVEGFSDIQLPGSQARFMLGELKLEDGLVMLLDVAAMLNEVSHFDHAAIAPTETPPETAVDAYALGVYRVRALELARIAAHDVDDGQTTWALVRLGGELFGLDIGSVREFVHLRSLTPVPGSPPFVAGNMNLRGDILTVLDIRAVLGVAQTREATEVAVLCAQGMQFGVLAEAIEEVWAFPAQSVTQRPNQTPDTLCPSVAAHQQGAASLIDLASLIRRLQTHSVPGAASQGDSPIPQP